MKPTFPTLSLKITHRTDDKTGRGIIRFQPVFIPDCTAQGELTFAYWEAYEDEPNTHASQQSLALSSARKAMEYYVKHLTVLP